MKIWFRVACVDGAPLAFSELISIVKTYQSIVFFSGIVKFNSLYR